MRPGERGDVVLVYGSEFCNTYESAEVGACAGVTVIQCCVQGLVQVVTGWIMVRIERVMRLEAAYLEFVRRGNC